MRRPLAAALIVAWAGATLFAISTLALPHMAPIGEATRGDRTMAALLALREDRGRGLVVHVIASGCSCTERLYRHLLERRRFGAMDEVVLFVGDDARKRADALRAGLRFATVNDEELVRRFALESAPVLFVFDAQSRLRYAGGYFNHPSAVHALDQDIEARLARGEKVSPLPVYGCAVGAALRDSVDPLGIRDAIAK